MVLKPLQGSGVPFVRILESWSAFVIMLEHHILSNIPCHLGFMSIIVGAQSQVHSGVYRGGRQKGNEVEKGELHYV